LSRKVLLDVDPGIDDAIAILTALKSDEIEVAGIATVYGNVIPQVGMLNTLRVLKSMNRMDIPVTMGAKSPLKKGLLSSKIREEKKKGHGKWGLGYLHVDPSIINDSLQRDSLDGGIKSNKGTLATDNHNNYLGFIDEIVKYYKDDEISIIATGPLTNIAQAIFYRPEFIRKISQLLIMGGAYGLGSHIRGNITNFAEFNFYCDPEAARLVLTSPSLNSKTKVVGLDVTQHPNCGLDREFVNKVRHKINAGKSPASELILSLLDFKLIYNTIFHLHDVLAVLLYERPLYFSFKSGSIKVTLGGSLRGHSEFIHNEIGKAKVATIVNGDRFRNFLYSRLISC
jgi:inosine-uridine nucleoside N-ribohydrolase